MKKTTIIFLLILISLLSFIIESEIGYAYCEGYPSYPYSNNATDYDYTRNYGTVDWIADGVLHVLLNYSNKFLFIKNMETIFFLGTEAVKNSNVHDVFNHDPVTGYGNYDTLYVIWNETYLQSENIGKRIDEIIFNITTSLKQEKYEIATYYYGAMISYISYGIYFPIHIVNGKSFFEYSYVLDNLLYPFTSSHINPTWFFRWDYRLFSSNITYYDFHEFVKTIIWNETVNITWYEKNIRHVSSIKDRFDLNEHENDTTYVFFNHWEFVFNLCINFIAERIYSIFINSGAEGGDIKPLKVVDYLVPPWNYTILIGSIVFFVSLIMKLRSKHFVPPWRKYKVHRVN